MQSERYVRPCPAYSLARSLPSSPSSKMHFFSFLSNKERKETKNNVTVRLGSRWERFPLVLRYRRPYRYVHPPTVSSVRTGQAGAGAGGFARSATYARSTVPLERLLGGAVTQPHLT